MSLLLQTNQETVNLNTLKQFYSNNKQMLDKEISKISMDNKFHVNPEEMFLQIEGGHTFIW